ncbi:tigger transposable element-derived protein [Plakobranchus ocellatus]|uniref:Tigger transposable element-derived protein n=1 Tax=Plakobranchus ocellatus TaxID=259542 RepID=A0AAV4B1J6_9GAST|nr:tigger transposable element-derived protein [Plakobranchus ocellatus]
MPNLEDLNVHKMFELYMEQNSQHKCCYESYRDAGDEFGIHYRTLARYWKKAKAEDLQPGATVPLFDIGYQKPRQVFTEQFEQELRDYLLHASYIYYSLTPKEVRKLAYELATANSLKVPESWNERKQAGEDCYLAFMKHNPTLSLRKPQPTILVRITAFNEANVDASLDKLVDVYNLHNIQPCDIWNIDETDVTTVQTPERIISRRGRKQVSFFVSAERGTFFTVVGTISASGNTVPPFFVFARVHFKDFLLEQAPPGSSDISNRIGWMQEDSFQLCLKHFAVHARCTKDRPSFIL